MPGSIQAAVIIGKDPTNAANRPTKPSPRRSKNKNNSKDAVCKIHIPHSPKTVRICEGAHVVCAGTKGLFTTDTALPAVHQIAKELPACGHLKRLEAETLGHAVQRTGGGHAACYTLQATLEVGDRLLHACISVSFTFGMLACC